jgi:DDE domain
VYRAIDQFGQVIDVVVAPRGDVRAARRCLERAIATTRSRPIEVVTEHGSTSPIVLDECCRRPGIALIGMPTTGLRPTRARVIIAGHAFVQNLRRGHYELAVEQPTSRRVAVAFDQLVLAI